jgi:hypothetical protein
MFRPIRVDHTKFLQVDIKTQPTQLEHVDKISSVRNTRRQEYVFCLPFLSPLVSESRLSGTP